MTKYKPEGWLLNTAENNSYCRSLSGLQDAMNQGRILEARSTVCTSSHDLLVDFGFCKGVIPRTQGAIGIEDGSTRDIAIISKVNKPVCFIVSSLRQNSDGSITPILSRRAAQEKCMEEYLNYLAPGDIIDARITHMESFGCFVDIGCGIASLIPIDCISVSRISHPSDRFRQGQDIRAVVQAKDEKGRISLTHKELLGTWAENAALFASGETVAGTVRSVEEYGIFVELTPNLAGLAELKDGVYPGQQASVYIKSLIPEKMKVKLIIVDAFDARYQPEALRYFIDGDHIDQWTYSPPCAGKRVETHFDSE